MNYINVLKLSKLISTKDYINFFDTINNFYKPNSCLHLISELKKEIFSSNSVYKVIRKIDNKTYNLNLEPDNFLTFSLEEDIEVRGNYLYKINYPNIVSVDNQNLNIISIIKSIKINDNWLDVNSYDVEELKLIIENIDIEDFRLLKNEFDLYLEKIEGFNYITFNKIKENLSFEVIIKFIIDNFNYEPDNLYEILLSLMRHFNFTYTDFKEIEFNDCIKMVNIGNKIVKEENDVNNKNE